MTENYPETGSDGIATGPVWVNGQPAEAVSAWDRGFLYGDSFFTTIRIVGGQPAFWPLHRLRLISNATRLRFPWPDLEAMELELAEFISSAPDPDGVVRLTISRGPGPRGYLPLKDPQVTRVLAWSPQPDYAPELSETGVDLVLCKTQVSCNPLLAGIKHGNRLAQVFAHQELESLGAFEGLMGDGDVIVGGCRSNVFAKIAGTWYTPRLERAGVAGVTRSWLMQYASIREVDLTFADFEHATSAVITSALLGLMPVRSIEGRELELCEEIPGWQHQYRKDAGL